MERKSCSEITSCQKLVGELPPFTIEPFLFFASACGSILGILFRGRAPEAALCRRHKDLERYLDWVLGFYRFAWPFLVRLSLGFA